MKKLNVCRRDVSGRVLEQSKACSGICGNRLGVICKDRCVEHLDFDAACATKKNKFLSGRMISKKFFDILIAPDSTGATTLLFRTDRQVRPDFMQTLLHYALTKRELVVAKMIWLGFTNREISKKLYVTLATVKTHINRIYSKLGEHAGILSQLRMN